MLHIASKKKKKPQALALSDKDLTTILVDQPKFTNPSNAAA